MDAVLTDLGEYDLALRDSDTLQRGQFALFTDDIFPSFATLLSSLHECNFPGYARVSPPWGLPRPDEDGAALVPGTQAIFMRASGSGPIVKAFLWGFIVRGNLWFVDRIPTAPITFTSAGNSFRLFPISYRVTRCPGSPQKGLVFVSGGIGIGGLADVASRFDLSVAGGIGIGGQSSLSGPSPLGVSGGAGFGGVSALPGISIVNVAGGFGFGGDVLVEGSSELLVSGGFGVGGLSSLPGVGLSDTSGGFGVGGDVSLVGGSIYSTFSTFTAANGTTIAAYTPNVGPSWTQVSGSSTIQSNQLAVANASVQTVAAGHSDGTLTSTVTPGSGGTSITLFRYQNSTNYWQLVTSSTQLLLIKVVAGSPTVVASHAGTFTSGTPYSLSLALAAGSISGTVNGVSVSASGQTFNQTQQTMGVSGASGAWNVDNFAFAP